MFVVGLQFSQSMTTNDEAEIEENNNNKKTTNMWLSDGKNEKG